MKSSEEGLSQQIWTPQDNIGLSKYKKMSFTLGTMLCPQNTINIISKLDEFHTFLMTTEYLCLEDGSNVY